MKQKFLAILKAGITPEKLALSVAIGLTLGVFPVLGSTTFLCAGAALLFGLNMPAIQLVNYLAYPLQFLLLIPFLRLGEFVVQAPRLPLTSQEIVAIVHAGAWHAIQTLWRASLHMIAGWLLTAPAAALLLYTILLPVFRRVRYTPAQ